MYDGIVNVYKEAGFTSHDVCAKLRGIYSQKKVGHTGTLDPMAEGVLIVVLGRATKLADLIITKRKRYIAEMLLGQETDTDDTSGQVTAEADAGVIDDLFRDRDSLKTLLENTFSGFIGRSEQIPPMYSAIKINGKKLYEYAREGKTVELKGRPIEVYSLKLKDVDMMERRVTFEVEASKGTYIRSLIRDMGRKLGCGATMSGLIRDEINGIYLKDSLKISDLQRLKEEGRLEESVLPMDQLLKAYPQAHVRDEAVKLLSNGNPLDEKCFIEDTDELKQADFFRVYMGDELQALYTYEREKNRYKVFKML